MSILYVAYLKPCCEDVAAMVGTKEGWRVLEVPRCGSSRVPLGGKEALDGVVLPSLHSRETPDLPLLLGSRLGDGIFPA